jgi:hypothetical protein
VTEGTLRRAAKAGRKVLADQAAVSETEAVSMLKEVVELLVKVCDDAAASIVKVSVPAHRHPVPAQTNTELPRPPRFVDEPRNPEYIPGWEPLKCGW